MLRRAAILLTVALASSFSAEIPRKSPEFAIETGPVNHVLVSQYRGKVLCLVFILTT